MKDSKNAFVLGRNSQRTVKIGHRREKAKEPSSDKGPRGGAQSPSGGKGDTSVTGEGTRGHRRGGGDTGEGTQGKGGGDTGEGRRGHRLRHPCGPLMSVFS